MKPIPLLPETEALARRLIWFETPSKALSDTPRFVAYAFNRATFEDMRVIGLYLTDDDLRAVLDVAPAGIISPRSWAYWNIKLGRYPVPPEPTRTFN